MEGHRYRFPKSLRIASGQDFTRVLRRGGCAADGVLVVFALPRSSNEPLTRIGITIPKKTGNAVIRNQWKRMIREAFRTHQHEIPAGFDLVVRPKKGAQLCSQTIRRGLPKLSAKAIRRYRPK